MNQRYKIVRSYAGSPIGEFLDEVNKLMEKGYKPLGPADVIYRELDNQYIYHQTMIKGD